MKVGDAGQKGSMFASETSGWESPGVAREAVDADEVEVVEVEVEIEIGSGS